MGIAEIGADILIWSILCMIVYLTELLANSLIIIGASHKVRKSPPTSMPI